jgi:hypothetical protein
MREHGPGARIQPEVKCSGLHFSVSSSVPSVPLWFHYAFQGLSAIRFRPCVGCSPLSERTRGFVGSHDHELRAPPKR